MRVLLLGTDSYGGHGGIALYNRDLAEALSLHPECEEIVIVPRLVRGEREPLPPRVRFVAEAARGPRHYLAALAHERRRPFDLVICGHVNLLPLLRFFDAPSLLLVYGIEAWKPLANPIGRRALQRCSGVISISDLTLARLRAWSGYAGPGSLLPNAVRAELYGLRPRRTDLAQRWQLEGRRVLLTVGRVVDAERYKGFDEVLEAMVELPNDIVYLIAGGGDDIHRLERKAKALGVADRIRFTGNFAEDEKADIYALADVYVMPSRGEGFGFVFLEALASGLPTIASKHDGGREALLCGELGLLVDPASPAEIRAAILQQLTRPRRIPEGLEHFAFARFVTRLHAIMDVTR